MNAKKYYVRGLPMMQPTKHTSISTRREQPAVGLDPYSSLRKIAQTLGRPSIEDYAAGGSSNALAKHWPTFGFFYPNSDHRPIRQFPVTLAANFCDSERMPSPWHEDLRKYCVKNSRTLDCLDWVQHNLSSSGHLPDLIANHSSLSASLMLHFAQTQMTDEKVRELYDLVSECPVASYISLSSGVRNEHRSGLLKSVAKDLNLALDLTITPCGNLGGDEILVETVKQSPIHNAALMGRLVRPDRKSVNQACERLMGVAEINPEAAAFCLGSSLSPDNRDQWIKLIQTSPEAVYWAIRTGTNQFGVPPSFEEDLAAHIIDDLRWKYHYTRDFARDCSGTFIANHWPHPWSIELAAATNHDAAELVNLHQQNPTAPETEDGYTSTVILWLAEYLENKSHEA